MMTRILSTLLLVAAPCALHAQDGPSSEDGQRPKTELEIKLEKKLAAPFATKVKWFTDLEKARAEAKKADKVIFAYFTRSYAP